MKLCATHRVVEDGCRGGDHAFPTGLVAGVLKNCSAERGGSERQSPGAQPILLVVELRVGERSEW